MAYNIMSRQVWKLQQRWYSWEDAKRIAYSQQLKNWHIKPWTWQLTEEWQAYSWMHPNDRAEYRKQKYKQNRRLKRQALINSIVK